MKRLTLSEDQKKAIKSKIEKRVALSRLAKANLLPNWSRNILYYSGKQWIKQSAEGSYRWRKKKLDPRIPTPYTNIFGSTVDALTSLFARIIPSFTFSPSTIRDEDKISAEVCRQLYPFIYEETGVEGLRHNLAKVVALTGNSFLYNAKNTEDVSLGYSDYEVFKCPKCEKIYRENGECENCESSLVAEKKSFPKGKLITELCFPWEIHIYPFGEGIGSWLIREKLRDKDWVESSYGKVNGSFLDSSTLRYFTTLSSNLLSGSNLINNDVVVWEEWELPCKDYPDGLYVCIVGNEIKEVRALPNKRSNNLCYIPFVKFGFEGLLNSAWCKTVANDFAVKQQQRNEIESLIQLIFTTTASPKWLKPEGANVSKISGVPGEEITYSPLAGAKPERIPGVPPSPILVMFLDKIDKDFEEISATFDILKGDRPPGLRAGYALQVLYERGYSRFAPIFKLWENSWADWMTQQIEIFKSYVKDERSFVIENRVGTWEAKTFKGGDISGNIAVIVESGSGSPKSQILERLLLKDLIGLGLVDIKGMQERLKVLDIFGMRHLAATLDTDVKDALKEQDAFLKSGVEGLRFEEIIDNHAIHLEVHKAFVKGDDFVKLDESEQFIFKSHIRQHFDKIMEALQPQIPIAPKAPLVPEGKRISMKEMAETS